MFLRGRRPSSYPSESERLVTKDEFNAHRTLIALLPDEDTRTEKLLGLLCTVAPYLPDEVVDIGSQLPYAITNRLVRSLRSIDPSIAISLVKRHESTSGLCFLWARDYWSAVDDAMPFQWRFFVLSRGVYGVYERHAAALERLLVELPDFLPTETADLAAAIKLSYLSKSPMVHANLRRTLWRLFLENARFAEFQKLMIILDDSYRSPKFRYSIVRCLYRAKKESQSFKINRWILRRQTELFWHLQTEKIFSTGVIWCDRPMPVWLVGRQKRLCHLCNQTTNKTEKRIGAAALRRVDSVLRQRKRSEEKRQR